MGRKFISDELLQKHTYLEIVINEFWDVWRRDYLLELNNHIELKNKKVFYQN